MRHPGEPKRNRAFDLTFNVPNMESIIDDLVSTDGPPKQALPVFTANVDHIVRLRSDDLFRAAYRKAWRISIDGAPVYLYCRLRGLDVDRVPGSDIVQQFFKQKMKKRYRFFFVASSENTAIAIERKLVEASVDISAIKTIVPPFGFEKDASYSKFLVDSIYGHGTTHLFLGVGSPKSENWISEHLTNLGGCYALCVGAGLDYFAATKERAPLIMQMAGLEWLWRVFQEPRRLFWRYTKGSILFIFAIARDLKSK